MLKTGTIKFFNSIKGYGFVVDDETGSDIFLHITNFKGVPKEGDKVTFEVKKDKKGLHAFNVVKA